MEVVVAVSFFVAYTILVAYMGWLSPFLGGMFKSFGLRVRFSSVFRV